VDLICISKNVTRVPDGINFLSQYYNTGKIMTEYEFVDSSSMPKPKKKGKKPEAVNYLVNGAFLRLKVIGIDAQSFFDINEAYAPGDVMDALDR